jgi:hypothetical protein
MAVGFGGVGSMAGFQAVTLTLVRRGVVDKKLWLKQTKVVSLRTELLP